MTTLYHFFSAITSPCPKAAGLFWQKNSKEIKSQKRKNGFPVFGIGTPEFLWYN
jgi:hypothetical protein